MSYFALEVDDKSKISKRIMVGSKEECTKVLETFVNADIEEDPYNTSYYRVVEISEEDKNFWDEQCEKLPNMDHTKLLFGEYVSIPKAADFLGVTFGRICQLITNGDIESKKINKYQVVGTKALLNRKLCGPKRGRPANSKNKPKKVEENVEAVDEPAKESTEFPRPFNPLTDRY